MLDSVAALLSAAREVVNCDHEGGEGPCESHLLALGAALAAWETRPAAAPAVEGTVACDCGVSVCGDSLRSDVACRGQLRIVEVGNERHLCEAHWDAGSTPPAETGR